MATGRRVHGRAPAGHGSTCLAVSAQLRQVPTAVRADESGHSGRGRAGSRDDGCSIRLLHVSTRMTRLSSDGAMSGITQEGECER